jgi:hypothetical protein
MVDIRAMAEIWKFDTDGYWIMGYIKLKYGRNLPEGSQVWDMAEIWVNDVPSA